MLTVNRPSLHGPRTAARCLSVLVCLTLLGPGSAEARPLRGKWCGLFGARAHAPTVDIASLGPLAAVKAAHADAGLREVLRTTGKEIKLAEFGGWWYRGGIVLTGRGVERWNRNAGTSTGVLRSHKLALSVWDRLWEDREPLTEQQIHISPAQLAAEVAALKQE